MLARRRFLFLAATAATVPLGGCTLFGASYETVRVSATDARQRINALRAEVGAGPLSIAPELQVIAAQQARLMAEADRLGHEVREGYDLAGRIRRARYQGIAGENVSAGYTSLERVIAAWMASPGHRRNLLNPEFTEFGIAAAQVADGRESRYGTYWSIVLGAPRSALPNGTPA